MKPFTHLNLSRPMLDNIEKLGYSLMTPIQEWAIPPILKGQDVLGQAKTGSGKTAAFAIGLLENLISDRFRVQALILCPTRELSEQVAGEIRRLAKFRHNIKVLSLTGGIPMHKQEHSLSHQAHIVVGTPGRINKLLLRGSLVPEEIGMLILDEADRMLDLGFIDQIHAIIDQIPQERQTLCFSATFSDEIKVLSREIMTSPKEITVESLHDETVINQHFYRVDNEERGRAVLAIVRDYKPESAVIFCNTKDACRRIQDELARYGLHSLALHGDLEQKERNEILIRFSNGSSPLLVATDVAARGLDIDDLGAVINYNLPFETETYIHRIGRTGRAGKEGMAFSLVKQGEQFRLDRINEMLDRHFTAEPIDCRLEENFSVPEPEMVTISINGGRKNKISAGDILGALTAEGGIHGSDVGKIDRMDFITFAAVKRSVVKKAVTLLSRGTIKGRQYKVMIQD